ncbi:MAG: SGNH/GDSL hydrolase family protein [Planctomycetes bacterium]|nr:SGNH/GDSL hydrolase family protein [Planctomycetota bacterium]
MRKILIRLLVVFASTLFALAAVEFTFRVWGSIEGRRMADDVLAMDPFKRPIVVFCGDSHIYGAYFEKEATIAAAVERRSKRDGSNGIRCINLGIPGAASWDVLEQARLALLVKPRAIVVRCGINNIAILPDDEGLGWLEKLRITKLIRRTMTNYRLAREAASGDRVARESMSPGVKADFIQLPDERVGFVMNDREGMPVVRTYKQKHDGEIGECLPRYILDCKKMAREARAAGAECIFLTYSVERESPFAPLTDAIRVVANEEGAQLVSCGEGFDRWLKAGAEPVDPAARIVKLQNRRAQYLVKDRHPAPAGYDVEASLVIKKLAGMGIVGNACIEEIEAFAPDRAPGQPAVAQAAGAPAKFEIRGTPGDDVVLLFGAAGSSVLDKITIPLDATALDKTVPDISLQRIHGVLGADGKTILSVDGEIIQKLPAKAFALCIASRGSGNTLQQFVSEPVGVKK